MHKHLPILLIAVALGCAKKADTTRSADTVAAVSTTASAGAEAPIAATENAVAPEVNPPGDIPDSQACINYTNSAGRDQLDVPEGWARTESGSSVSFVNKFDGVKVDVVAGASGKKSAASVRTDEAKALQAQGRAVSVNAVSDVKLPAGDAVVIKYTSNSEPNPVTNKKVRLENETYLFFRNGREATLTLWAPQGADNVDQWQRMAKSFRWK
jgi:hypothetical protein